MDQGSGASVPDPALALRVEPASSLAASRIDPSRRALIALAVLCETEPHLSRAINRDIGALLGEQFNHAYTNGIDLAARLIPDGYLWCVGIADDHEGGPTYAWANVRLPQDSRQRLDVSTRAATPPLALTAACLRVLAADAPKDGPARHSRELHREPVGDE